MREGLASLWAFFQIILLTKYIGADDHSQTARKVFENGQQLCSCGPFGDSS